MPRDRLTAKERWEAVLKGEVPDKVPTDYRATDEMTQKLLAHLGFSSSRQLAERFHWHSLLGVGPRYVGPPAPKDRDIFGVRYQWVDYGSGRYWEAVECPLAGYNSVAEIEANYRWPCTRSARCPAPADGHARVPTGLRGVSASATAGSATIPAASGRAMGAAT